MSWRALFSLLTLVVLTILSTLSRVPSAHAADLSENEYRGARAAGLHVLASRPPSEFLYVGIGRSPTPVIAFLRALTGEKSADQIAFSAATATEREALSSPDARRMLDEHLERSLAPLIRRAGGRRLLLIDYVVNGGFRSAVRVIDDFLERRYPHVFVDYVALVNQRSLLANLDWLKRENILSLDTLPFEFERKIRASEYDSLSPVGSWRIGAVASLPGEKAASYASEMRARVSHDEVSATYAHVRCENVFVQ